MSFVLISNSIVSCKNKFKSKRERAYNRTTFRCYRDAVFKFQKRLVDKLSEKIWFLERYLVETMVDNSTDDGNDFMATRFVLLFLARSTSATEKLQQKWTSKTVNAKVKNKNRWQYSMVSTLIVHRNDVNMFKTLHLNHLSFEHSDVISMVDESTGNRKLLAIC